MMLANDGDIVAAFVDAMRSAGVNMDMGAKGGPHPIADGKLHRAPSLDAKNKRNFNCWYVLHLDEPSSGAFGDYAKGVNETWTAGRTQQQMTPQERETLRKRMEEAAAERAAMREQLGEESKAAAVAILAKTSKAGPEHPYLAKKKLRPFPGLRLISESVKYKVDGQEKTAREGWLFVPVYTPQGELVGGQTIRSDGVKSFIKGMPKAGNYHSIGKAGDPTAPIVIGEGYATCARIHEATGHLAVVAFDSGNLPSVARAIREKYPDAPITIAADNDRFTTTPIENPGLKKAKEAAFAVRGLVAVPHFNDGLPEATDFDDLFRVDGLDAIRAEIEAAVPPRDAKAEKPAPPPPARPAYDESNPPPMDFDPGGPDAADGEPAPSRQERRPSPAPHGDGEETHSLATFGFPHFRCLGIDGTTLYYQPANVSQVIDLAASAHRPENLMRLAPLNWWEIEFPSGKKDGGVDWKMAVNACMQACMFRRKFVPHNAVRGRGAWFEGETPVFHAGERIVVGGRSMEISEHKSRKFVYDEGDEIPVELDRPATDEEARRFLEISKSLRWSSPLSGYLLAGWCVVAPVCGFLKWRPHIWVNGPAGSGKSTVIAKIIKQALADTAHSVVGNTSEAGIRGALGMDALPVVFDESEPKDMASQARIRSILDLARVAASESDGLILKGTSNQRTKGYRARSMFAFASINTQIEGYADETRFTQLTLQAPDARSDAEVQANADAFTKLISEITDLFRPDFARRLLGRTILNLATLREYVRVFTEAASLHLGQPRLGDQIGPMLAGAYLLATTKPITVEQAREWIKKNDWVDHSAKNAARDVDRFMQHVTGYMVRNQTPEGGTWERPIADLIEIAMEGDYVTEANQHGDMIRAENKRKASAIKALGRLGIKVRQSSDFQWVVDITTTHENFKQRVLRGTQWQGTNLRQLFQTIPGCIPGKGSKYFATGVNTPFVTLPLAIVACDHPDGYEEDEG